MSDETRARLDRIRRDFESGIEQRCESAVAGWQRRRRSPRLSTMRDRLCEQLRKFSDGNLRKITGTLRVFLAIESVRVCDRSADRTKK
ncbi:MAG: hypothetical protein ACFB9N_03840 [Geitlerinemataceae cyanobacterium]